MARQGAESRAEAEALDTDLKGNAAAAKEVLQERFQTEGAQEGFFNFEDFAMGEFFPTGSDGRIVAEAAEEKLDFGEGEAHFAGEANEKDAIEGFGGVTPLAAEALGWSEETHFFIIADGGGVEIGAAGELADFHNPP
jgi:hypothetical protein